MLAAADAGDVVEDIEAAEGSARITKETLHLNFVPCITQVNRRFPTEPFGAPLVQASNNDLGPFFQKAARSRQSNARSGADQQAPLILKSIRHCNGHWTNV